MKLVQVKPKYSPISLVLETEEEAEHLWEIMDEYCLRNTDSEAKQFAINICNSLSMDHETLKAERDDFKQALEELGVTPEEARKGAKRSRDRIEQNRKLKSFLEEAYWYVEGENIELAKKINELLLEQK